MSNLTVVKHNHLVTASYSLSIGEQRVLLSCIAQINARGEVKTTDSFQVTASEIAELTDTELKSQYRDMVAAVDRLYSRSIKLDDRGTEFRWLCGKEYSNGTATLYFSPQIIPYLSQLSSQFTSYRLQYVGKFKNKYSIRVYEFLCQWLTAGERKFEVDAFRDMLQLHNRYESFRELKRNVIVPAVAEISEFSNIWCEVDFKTFGRKVSHIIFRYGIKGQDEKPKKTKLITDAEIQKAARPGETTGQVISRLRGEDLSKTAKPGETIEQAKVRKNALAEAKKKLSKSR